MSEGIIELISTVGFPITMCLLIYFDLRKLVIEIRDELRSINGSRI